MNQYIVLIGDMEGSKRLEEPKRKAAQEKLQQALDELNEQGNSIVSRYSITLGDEFQAVLNNADSLFDHIWHILAGLNPIIIRFSIGIGTIATSIQREHVLGMDGPAFHVARDGIEKLKKSEGLFRITIENEDRPELSAINQSLYLLSVEIRSWKSNRIALQHLIRQGMDYKKIPKKIDISERAFYKNKEAGSLDVVNAYFNDIQDYINSRLKG